MTLLQPMKIFPNQREQMEELQQHSKLEMLLGYLPDVYVPKPGVRRPETERGFSGGGVGLQVGEGGRGKFGQNCRRLFSSGLWEGSALKTRNSFSEGPET